MVATQLKKIFFFNLLFIYLTSTVYLQKKYPQQKNRFYMAWLDFDLLCCSRCFSMMVKWANDGLHQANDGERSSMMVKWVYHTIIWPSLTSISPSLTCILPSLASSKPPFAHSTIIEKLDRLYRAVLNSEK